MPEIKFYADCIRKGDDPEAVLSVALGVALEADAARIARLKEIISEITDEADNTDADWDMINALEDESRRI